MASKTYNINFIIILILIILILWLFISTKSSYQYYNLSNQKIIEGAVTTEIIPTKKLLLTQDNLLVNWGITFTVNLKNRADNNWRQIIGITPDSNGGDSRFFGAWICPNTNNLYLRICTESNWDAGITECGDNIFVDLNRDIRFDVIVNMSNSLDGKKQQNVVVIKTDIGKNESKQIRNKTMDPPKFTRNNTPQVYIFTSYDWCLPIDGTLKNVAFVTTNEDDYIVQSYLRQDRSQLNVFASKKSGFTTMNDTVREGLDNIGGIGNNGNIPGLTPPINPNDSLPATRAVGYQPILIKDKQNGTRELCANSVVQATDNPDKLNLISDYGYNYPIEKNATGQVTKSVPICSPDELYTIQSEILNKLNLFNQEYSDYVTYLYNKKHNVSGDRSKKLQYINFTDDNSAASRYGSITDVTQLDYYKNLIQDVETYNNLLKANKEYYSDPEVANKPETGLSRIDPIILARNHKDIVDKRNELDVKLFELNNVQNSAAGESKMYMDSSIYVTLLWTTLATSIIYYMFI